MAAVLAVAGCQPTSPARPADPAAFADLRIGLSEYAISTSAAAVLPGINKFIVTNAGSERHDLRVSIDRRTVAQTDVLAPGQVVLLTFRSTAPSVLRLTCSLPGHVTAGMRISVPVRAPVPYAR